MIAAITASTNVLIAAKPCAIGTSTSGFGLIGRCRPVPKGSASSCAIISSVISESGGSGESAAPTGLSGTTTGDSSVGTGARRSPGLPAG